MACRGTWNHATRRWKRRPSKSFGHPHRRLHHRKEVMPRDMSEKDKRTCTRQIVKSPQKVTKRDGDLGLFRFLVLPRRDLFIKTISRDQRCAAQIRRSWNITKTITKHVQIVKKTYINLLWKLQIWVCRSILFVFANSSKNDEIAYCLIEKI